MKLSFTTPCRLLPAHLNGLNDLNFYINGRASFMQLNHGLISVDDHIQEPPDLWTNRLSKGRWTIASRTSSAPPTAERWVVDGQVLLDGGPARAAALMADRNHEPSRWQEVPPAAYRPTDGLKPWTRRA